MFKFVYWKRNLGLLIFLIDKVLFVQIKKDSSSILFPDF